MYFATDIQAIADAMEAKAPRPVEEILRDMYPDCTIDRNGRAHAPHDGYLCPLTDRVFRGGEYLPFEAEDFDGDIAFKQMMTGPARPVYLTAMTPDGKVHMIEGTKGQRRAGGEVAKDQAEAWDREASHVGTVKARDVFDLTLVMVFENIGFYGAVYTHYFRDDEGNSVVYKGSKKFEMKLGNRVSIKATVKSHWTSPDGRKATYVNRPAIISK